MPKTRFPLSKLPQLLKNPPPDKDIMLYDKRKRGPVHHPGGKFVKKSRMDRLEESIDKLAKKIDNLGNDLRNEMNAGFKQVNSRIDQLESRIDSIEVRLDYNNLKKLPKNR